ncbi:MAG: hypothetical protein P8J89_00150 [Phycisphaerales bacterium]|nr:hypothetical protein [Phycisphaerales bacterium]|tara:strand:+ start:5998 stop:7203 length:1206 start_codon:yes stop_codon:yes gene_type:complete
MMTSVRKLPLVCLAFLLAGSAWSLAALAPDGVDAQADLDTQEDSVRVYVVPIRGQVGTDIVPRIYEEVIEDIKEQKPDIVVFELESSDERNVYDDNFVDIYEGEVFDEQRERSMLMVPEMTELRVMFDDKLPGDMKQVLWVHDAVGASSALGLAWCDFYMTPDAKIGNMGASVRRSRGAAGDSNVEAKFGQAAFQGLVRITAYGDCDPMNPTRRKLINAMAMPEMSLSVFMMGRQYMMANHKEYETVLDANDEMECRLTAEMCDDLCISDGTAESIEDLMVLLGERQFMLVEGKAGQIVADHYEGWRDAYARAIDAYQSYQKWMKRASGKNFRSSLSKAEKALKSLRSNVMRYPEVSRRMGGLTTDRIDIMLRELEKMKRSGKGRPGGGGGGGGPRGPAGS